MDSSAAEASDLAGFSRQEGERRGREGNMADAIPLEWSVFSHHRLVALMRSSIREEVSRRPNLSVQLTYYRSRRLRKESVRFMEPITVKDSELRSLSDTGAEHLSEGEIDLASDNFSELEDQDSEVAGDPNSSGAVKAIKRLP
uniref:Uncharacterized protein n=1 Tax=Sphaerodactylus townsendi TaxID=933632 RepID=A0ACB8EJY0_9SAUR